MKKGSVLLIVTCFFGLAATAQDIRPLLQQVKEKYDRVIDYTAEDFTKNKTRFDIIFDAVGKTSKSACRHILKPKGKYVSVFGSPDKNPNDLLFLKDLIESGKLKTVIDRRYTLEQIRDAHAYVENFHKKGNVVIKVFES